MLRLLLMIGFISLSPIPYTHSNPDGEERKVHIDKKHEERILNKIKQLGGYLQIVADKSVDPLTKRDIQDLVIKMFIDESSMVQVSSVNHNYIKNYTIRRYLTELKLLPYERVNIEWAESMKVSKFVGSTITSRDQKAIEEYQADKKMEGVITILQKFEGLIDEEIVYSDFTIKSIQVIILEFESAGNYRDFIVKFDDIEVLETHKENPYSNR